MATSVDGDKQQVATTSSQQAPATELRVYLSIPELQPQVAAYLATPVRARGYPPVAGDHSLIIEVAPALAIHRIADLALKSVPELEAGILFVERQFGVIELHSTDRDLVDRAGNAILEGIGAKPSDQLKPYKLYSEVIADVSDQHAIVLNRSREASMILPGHSLLLYEMVPALFALLAANEAETEAPLTTLVDVQMIGASGRVFVAGGKEDLERAKARVDAALASVQGRKS
jgi:hypothetical protein